MLESLVASLLNRFLGSYVKNFDPKQLNIGIWSGDVKLKNLSLKREALDQLKLPIDVVEGHLGELVLQIPWSNLKNKPVKVLINDVFLIAVPKLDQDYNAAEEERRELQLKLNKLEDLEVSDKLKNETNLSPEETQKNQNFTDSLVTKIVDNLQITINNIHIRYEDDQSVPGQEFSIGVSLKELSAVSTDDNWEPCFIQDTRSTTHKLAKLNSLLVYWNTQSKPVRDMDPGELIEFMKDSAQVDDSVTHDFQYILRPVSGVGHITLNKDISSGPKTKIQLLFDELAFIFDSEQYRNMLWVAELFEVYQRSREFKQYRPLVSVKKDPKAWFKYAANVVLKQVRQKRQQWTWDYIIERRNDRVKYVELFKKKSLGQIMTLDETEKLGSLEKKYSFEDLRFFRSLAKSELRKEKALLKPQEPTKKENGWSSWIWGSNNKAAEQQDTEVIMTDEQRQELYDAIEWDEKQAVQKSIDIPKDTITMEVEAALKSGSFRLRNDPHGNTRDVVTLLFNGFNSAFYNRPDSYLANLSLHELRVDDGSDGTLYKQVVTVKSISSDILPGLSTTEESLDTEIDDTVHAVNKDAFFWLSFESNPLGESADSNLFIKMKSITIFYNATFLENVVRFFKPPQTHMDTIGAIINAAGATVEEIRDQTRMGLEYALQQHKTVNIKLDMQAPLIVIPLDHNSWSSPCAIIDAGHISAISHLVGKDVIEDVKKKKDDVYTDDDWKRLESLMYDKYNVQFHNTQILIGSNVRDTMRQLHNRVENNPTSVVDKTNMDFLVEISILPDAHNLSKFKVSGNLPKFSAYMSDAKYKIMMKLIDVCIPNFSFDLDDAESENLLTRVNSIEDGQSSDNRHRSRSFSTAQADLILPDHDDSDNETATITSTKGSEKTNQKIFEFNFRVDMVQMFLYRCTNMDTFSQEPLVDMTLKNFDLYYYYKDGEMAADVVLKSLAIKDYVQKDVDPELTKFATSIENSNTNSNKDLFKVRYKRVASGKIDTLGNAVNNQFVDVTLSTLKFVVSPKSFLTILDFIITTFTDPNQTPAPNNPNQSPATETLAVSPNTDDQDAKIDLKLELNSIILLLNDDGIRLATTTLESAFVNVFMVPEKMTVEARIGKFTLLDEIDNGTDRDSMLRKLISNEGDDLADFKYQSFLPGTNEYNSSIFFHAGSITFNVVEEPFSRIIAFGSKFVQMKALYDSARQTAFNQANQIEDANKIHFDILIKTPIMIFPRINTIHNEIKCDTVTAHLGEIYAKNKYVVLPDDHIKPLANQIDLGIRSTRLFSKFHFPDVIQSLEIIDNLDMSFDVSYVEPYKGITRPLTVVTGKLTETTIRVTEVQYQFLMEMLSTVSGIFGSEGGMQENEIDELERELKEQKHIEDVALFHQSNSTEIFSVDKVDFTFDVSKLALSLYNNTTNVDSKDLEKTSLSKFCLDDSGVKLHIRSNNDLESDIHIKSFTVHDTRSVKDNKFTKIIPSANTGEYQFLCNISISGSENDKIMKTVLTVDSPKMILAMDYLFALKAFISWGFPPQDSEEELPVNEDMLLEAENPDEAVVKTQPSSMKMYYHINVIDASVILLANPKLTDSEAIVFKVEHFVLSQEETTVMSVSKVGVFLCKMNAFDKNRLRILDDFSMVVALDDRNSSSSDGSKIDISVEPLVLRLALRDIFLALDIVKRASAMSSEVDAKQTEALKDKPAYSRFSKKGTSGRKSSVSTRRSDTNRRHSSISTRRSDNRRRQSSISTPAIENAGKPPVRGQHLCAEFDGMRLVLIGTMNELPMLDMCAKAFKVDMRDWDSNLSIKTSIETFVNIYNSEKSAWEPLIEPWDLGLHVARSVENNNTSIDIFSRKLMEVTVTTQTVSTISRAIEFISDDIADDFLLHPRDHVSPYLVLNQTGFSIEIWVDGGSKDEDKRASIIKDGEEIPWRFYDWHTVRENLSTDAQRVNLGVRFLNSPYEPVRNISVTAVGEHLYTLYPKIRRVSHRLLCEVVMDDSIKRIVLRSALKVENKTQAPMIISIGNPSHHSGNESAKSLTWELQPGTFRAIPIDHMYDSPISVRPFHKLPFKWSDTPIYWKELLDGPKSIVCPPENASVTNTNFFIQATGIYDNTVPLTKIYPHMNIVLSAPLEIVNLLPFDFSYRVYDKTSKKEWTNTVKQGQNSSMYVVELSHLIMLSVHPNEGTYENSSFAVINGSEFKIQDTLTTRNRDGQKLTLKLNYVKEPGLGVKVMVYSPYVILNKTGLDVKVVEKSNTATSKVQNVSTTRDGKEVIQKKAVPKMWSFDNDSNKRALIKVGDSKWSQEVSFDTIGKDSDVVIPSNTRQSEIHVGVHITEGLGIYKLSKIVTLTPRFIVHNKLKDDIQIRDPGSSEPIVVEAGLSQPIHFLRRSGRMQLTACFFGSSSQWSAPFPVSDIGSIYLRVYKHGSGYGLLKIDILMEDATIFLHIKEAGNNWPYSVRNFTNRSFSFHQANPYVDDTGIELSGHPQFQPVVYDIPPKSFMPYAWDYPAAPFKELVITANGKERRVQLAEIGNLPPMKIPNSSSQSGGIVDLNVIADGPTQTLVLSDYDPEVSLYKLNSSANNTSTSLASNSSSTATGDDFTVQEDEGEVTLNVNVKFEGIGLSLINKRLQELCYLTWRGVEFNFKMSDLYDIYSLKIKWIQIDNQLFGGVYPIILFPSVIPKTGKEMEAHPTFSTSLTRVRDDNHGVFYVKFLTVLLQEITLEMDEDFLFALIEFFNSYVEGQKTHIDKLCDLDLHLPEPLNDNQGTDYYFEILSIQPAQMDLSFVRTEHVNADDKTNSQTAFGFFLNALTMAIGNINDAPVRLNALVIENVRSPLPLLLQSITSHYRQEFMYQIHKILGSADFLGNPVGLFNNLSSGFMDIFYEPYQGYILNDRPQELGIGIAKGGLSFMKKSVFGFSDSISKVTGSISKGLSAVTMDREFQDQRRLKQSRNRPKHALNGFANGANSFLDGIASGVTGLASAPINGARDGAGGFFKGLGKGLVGLPTKTAIGLFDFATSISEGVKNTTTIFDGNMIERIRPPRYIAYDGVIRPYSQRSAQGQEWLKTANSGEFFNDKYLAHLSLAENEVIVMVSFLRILLLSTSTMTTEWEVKFKDLQTIAMERTGIALVLRGGVQGPFVPIPDDNSRKYLYKQIGIAVAEYNRKYQTLA